ncbi:MAG TPA: DUF1501 domain-containing protein [Kofleriaceae bacterium]|nr:DUF1501 domain-containing protein [Kofleriaceae bacterium]
MTIQRRSFLRGAAAGLGTLVASSGISRLARTVYAASTARYAGHRSLVGVFLLGGNDGNQLLIPADTTRYQQYAAERPTLKLALADLRKISPNGMTANSFGLHPSMQHLQSSFAAGKASMVCNVGPVFLPTTKALYGLGTHPKPTNLLSHSDQQDAWSSAAPIPSLVGAAVARSGWGGRLGGTFLGVNPSLPSSVEYPGSTLLGGRRLFVAGPNPALVLAANGTMDFVKHPNAGFEALRRERMSELAGIHDTSLEEGYGGELGVSVDVAEERTRAMADAWAALPNHATIEALVAGVPAEWTLPGQMLSVLREIVAAATPKPVGLGLKRQVISLGLGGFDTHAGQGPVQADLLAQLDKALQVFSAGIDLITASWPHANLPPQSTLFAMSDFGRTLSENSDGGTDHGWGNHLFVLGNRVAGRSLFGVYPDLDLATSQDTTDGRGRWIPTTSVDQYAYDLALWMGATGTISTGELASIFPNHAAYVQYAVDNAMPAAYRRVRLAMTLPDV